MNLIDDLPAPIRTQCMKTNIAFKNLNDREKDVADARLLLEIAQQNLEAAKTTYRREDSAYRHMVMNHPLTKESA